MSRDEGRLTDEAFWDDYWDGTPVPATLDLGDPGTRALARAIRRMLVSHLGTPGGKSLLELGCAPGRWLAYFYREGFRVAGVESAPSAVRLTRQNLDALGVAAEIYEGDALDLPAEAHSLESAFDCVVSLGLVEHFEDPLPLLRVHRWLAKQGGLILVGVPNLAGLSGALQRRLDREWLELHNTAIMRPDALEAIGRRAGLQPLEVTWAGSFDPNLYNWRGRSLLGYAVTRAGKLLRKIPGTDSLQSRHWSSYLLAAFSKPG